MNANLADALKTLPLPPTAKWPQGECDRQVIRHGTMSVSVFAPRRHDYQTPHAQDELYFVMRGSAVLLMELADGVPSRQEARPGDVFLVPAGVAHRFENLSEDFATWVVFWGPVGGECTALSADPA